jgi:23S rRNA G2445 N2-methylase RlmL
MKYVAICAKGLEDMTQLEIKELLNVNSEVLIPGRVAFETENIETFISKTQSSIKVYELKQHAHSLDEIKTFPIEGKFKATCSRKGAHKFSSNDVEKEIGKRFFEEGNKVDLKEPKVIVFIDIVDEDYFIGIDLTPKLLSKREYRIKIHNQSINSCIAYSLVRLSGFDETKILLDPFAKDGAVTIEAARFQKGKIFALDELFPCVRNVEINSKLAGVRKDVNVSRMAVEWLDTKFKEKEIDCVVSAIPFASKTVPENLVKKIYKELFYQLDFILKKDGVVVLISPKIELLKEMNEKLEIVEERQVSTSSLEYYVIVFKKKS